MKIRMYTCCCWSLKTGVVIFGILEIIRFLIILACAVFEYSNLVQNNTGYRYYTEYIYESDVRHQPKLLYFYVPACFAMFVFSSLMIFGTKKNNYKFIMPHSYAHIFLFISSTISQLYKIIVEYAFHKDIGHGSVLLVKGFLSSIFDIYFCSVEFSRIKELKGCENIIHPEVS